MFTPWFLVSSKIVKTEKYNPLIVKNLHFLKGFISDKGFFTIVCIFLFGSFHKQEYFIELVFKDSWILILNQIKQISSLAN